MAKRLILIAAVGLLCYANSFYCSFHFDDEHNIVSNSIIQNLSSIKEILLIEPTRALGNLTFALNFHFGGLDVFGYHLLNFLIHIMVGWLVFWLASLFVQSHSMSTKPIVKKWLPILAALLFVSHPVQTQAVTYIVQRLASLCTLFYLLALCSYLKWCYQKNSLRPAADKNHYKWLVLSLFSCLAAMVTKEISATLPLAIIMLDYFFIRQKNDNPLAFIKRTWIFISALLIVPIMVMIKYPLLPVVSESYIAYQGIHRVSWGDYLLTQLNVISTYLRLLVFPIDQNLDYDYPFSHSLWEFPTLLSAGLLTTLILFGVVMFNRQRIISFGILFFFTGFLVESIYPLPNVIFEHRVYLSSVGFVIALSTALLVYVPKLLPLKIAPLVLKIGCAFALGVLCLLTYQRNKIWKNDMTLWNDVVKKSPHKARARYNLGNVYLQKNLLKKAIDNYAMALGKDSLNTLFYNNFAIAHHKLGNIQNAIDLYKKSIQFNPAYEKGYFSLGNLFAAQNRFDSASYYYSQAHVLNSKSFRNNYKLALAYQKNGNPEKAIPYYKTALKKNPNSVKVHSYLADIYAEQDELDSTIFHYKKALGLNPTMSKTFFNLGVAYQKKGDFGKSLLAYKSALNQDSNNVDVYLNLGILYMNAGKSADAIKTIEKALALEVKKDLSHYHLGYIYEKTEDRKKAIFHYKLALKLNPKLTPAKINLDRLLRNLQ